jgi:hypothetical protein
LSVHRALELLRCARFEPARPLADALARIHARYALDLSKSRARCGFSRGHLLDVVVYVPGGQGSKLEQEAAAELVESLVGEACFERWIGTVSATPTVRGGPLMVLNANAEERSAFPIQTLHEATLAAITGLKQGLAGEPSARLGPSEDWVLFELSPEPALDYAAQDDLLLASTRMPELKMTFLRGERVFSGRFSARDDLFGYLKYESSERTVEARLVERAALEDELGRALKPAHGALCGVGIGLRYVYLDLALSDPNCVEGAIFPALRARGMPKRAWLLFCDSELEHEWLGVHADTPEPFFG